MKTAFSLFLMAILASPLAAQEAASAHWYADFDEAASVAAKEGKDLFVDFTGSDWCGWCIRLDEEVFEHEGFFSPVSKDYVLVKLDYPQGDEAKAKVPNPKRNDELSEKYSIQGFPTILLMNSEGEVFGQTGYQEGGPEAYVSHLKEIAGAGREKLVEAKTIQEEFKSSDDKEAVVRKAISLLGNPGDIGRTVFASVVREGFVLDPNNESGLKAECLKSLLAAGQADVVERALAFEMDPKNEMGLNEQVVLGQFQTVRDQETATAAVDSLVSLKGLGKVHGAEEVQEAALMAAYWCNAEQMLNQPETAKSLLAWAKSLGPVPEQFNGLVEEIEKTEEGQEKDLG
ncbi:MAG TPA: hypothetical protein DDW23_05375 [Planctomycetes bacterium]|nr:hypothetical protein [Planctomycetota bacterium]|tara:strand:+ start:233 stop:1264 length:1032 start_codon:yes stop_codon:yes gene_type:complete